MQNKSNQLPPRYRGVYKKVFTDGKDFMAAARELKITQDSVRVQVAKIKQFLKERII